MKKNILLAVSLLLVVTVSVKAQSYIAEKNYSKMKVKPVTDIQAYAFDIKDVR